MNKVSLIIKKELFRVFDDKIGRAHGLELQSRE